jgi:hypothetical protein
MFLRTFLIFCGYGIFGLKMCKKVNFFNDIPSQAKVKKVNIIKIHKQINTQILFRN